MSCTAAVGGIYRHKKTGNNYIVTGFCMIEKDWVLGVLYIPQNDTAAHPLPIVRPQTEFEDGRFETVKP